MGRAAENEGRNTFKTPLSTDDRQLLQEPLGLLVSCKIGCIVLGLLQGAREGIMPQLKSFYIKVVDPAPTHKEYSSCPFVERCYMGIYQN